MDYQDKILKEIKWYQESSIQNHFLNSRLFFSPERNRFNYIFPKKQMAKLIQEKSKLHNFDEASILIAPLGTGGDVKYLLPISTNISGIDLSKEAIARFREAVVKKYIGDMRNMEMFVDNSFDILAIPLFFHHFLRFGFDDFLIEAYRVLRPGGFLVSLEPSVLYPLTWVTRSAKAIFGNITGQVEDETPFLPFRLSASMKRCGFKNVHIYGASFSHNRIPVPIAIANNILTYPLLKCPLLKYFAWLCLFYGEKES